jgi:lysozyme
LGFFISKVFIVQYDNLIQQIKSDEGERLRVYKCTKGKNTIGYGRNLDDNGISKQEAEMLLINDLHRVEEGLQRNELINGHDYVRRAVLYNMAFQLGINGLLGFEKMIAAYRIKDYRTAAEEMLDSLWASEKQTPKRAKRLANQMISGEWQ